MAKHGKRLRNAYEGVDREKQYDLDEAIKLVDEDAAYSTSSWPTFSRFTVEEPVTTGERLPGLVSSRNAAS